METAGSLSITHLILNASLLVQVVMLFLLGLSIYSWTIIISKSNAYKNARNKADEFEDRFWSGIDLNNLYQDCIKKGQNILGLEVIYSSGFKEFIRLINSGPADQEVVMDGTYRQMKVSQSREMENLESHLATLATIGSISPYIGLFGTVWGIMHAFIALAAVKNATLSMVAPPIAEALIATAMGLFAAIPAVMFYNRFISKVEALENRYINFMDEFATILNRRLVRVRSELNSQMENRESREMANSSSEVSRESSAQHAGYAQPQHQNYAKTQERYTEQSNANSRYTSTVQYQTPGVEGDRQRAMMQQKMR
jgi:biopolymer transport protein TolQ